MGTVMLVAAIGAVPLLAAAGGEGHGLPHAGPAIAELPMAAVATWPVHRCGDGAPGTYEAAAEAAIDDACARLDVHDGTARRDGARRRWRGGGTGNGAGAGWRVARAMLPALQGLVGPGGVGLGIGSELQFVRGAHWTLHLSPARDTRIAATAFAPETTVLARCGACWSESEAAGAGINGGRRAMFSTASR